MKERSIFFLIVFVSVAIPLVVAYLFFGSKAIIDLGIDVAFLPKWHAMLNSITAVLLMTGYFYIRSGWVVAHRFCMLAAFFLSALFLISYVIYHSSTAPTVYEGEGPMKYIYYFVLITHIVLAIVIVPLVLFTLYRAVTTNFEKHRKIARWTLPLWLYVAVTGVLVYVMISPYY